MLHNIQIENMNAIQQISMYFLLMGLWMIWGTMLEASIFEAALLHVACWLDVPPPCVYHHRPRTSDTAGSYLLHVVAEAQEKKWKHASFFKD